MKKLLLSAAACLVVPSAVFAQSVRPDAGQVLQGNLDKKVAPPTPVAPGVVPKLGADFRPAVAGGPQVLVSDVKFEGNTVYTGEELKRLLSDQLGRKYDLAGMKQLAEVVTAFYREQGYPFARVLVPVQEFDDGVLKLRILEGRYASVLATGPQFEIDGAEKFLRRLRSGELIFGPELETTMLILDDLPGVAVSPTVSPGAKLETADLAVAVRLEDKRGGDLTYDNHGSRFTGRHRLKGQYYENSLVWFGDKASVDFVGTNHEMLLGSIAYDRPWGGQGLRTELSYSNTSYILAEDYAAMGISGLARIWSAKLSYPLYRSQNRSFYLSVAYQHKVLHDSFPVLAAIEDKSSDLLVAAFRFDVKDGWGGGGLTYGSLTSTSGHLNLHGNLGVADSVTARKAGQFNKVALDVARMQALPGNCMLYLRYTAQWADQNLDSSEKLGGGGADAVRAYPLGEATGDVGWLGQVEVRYQAGNLAPYLFFDACYARANYRAWDVNSTQSQRISGYGVGVRSTYGKWSSDLSVAQRGQGGVSQSDGAFGRTVYWVSLGRSF
jgi:hemolysin activation/secretion protein